MRFERGIGSVNQCDLLLLPQDYHLAMTKLERIDAAAAIRALTGICETLSEEDFRRFVSTVCVERYRKNEMIYHEGDRPNHLLCIHTGKVKIYREGIGGRSLINRVLRPTQYFGYRASMASEDYITAAAAFEDTTLITIPMRVVYEVMIHNPQLCHFFIRELACDLGEADRRIVSITQKHIRGRLAESLLSLLDIYGLDDSGMLDLRISREDLANLSNMTTSNAIRTLSAFASEGLIEVHGRYIRFLDIENLQRISEIG